jgi:hypothetical protein
MITMGTVTKTITIQMPVTAAYKIVKEIEAQTYPLVKDFGAVSAAPIEDIPNIRYATEAKQYGTSVKVFYDFKPTGAYTEIIINVEYGRLAGKTSGKLQMLYYVSFLKAMEMGYLAALEGGAADTPDICKNCGKELDPEFAVCPFCGTPR